MREMLAVTSAIAGAGMIADDALITDGRFSGGSHGIVVGHMAPEAQAGGPIAAIQEGDIITIDLDAATIDVDLAPAVLQSRLDALPQREIPWSARVAVLHPSCSDGMVALSILVHALSIWIRMSRGNGKRHRAMIADTVGSQHAWVVRRFSPFVDGMSSTTSIGTLLTSEDALISDWVKLGEDMHTSAWVILGTSDNDERSRST